MWFFWESTQKARREHFCDRCFTWIQPGEIYERKMWVPKHGTWFVMKEHVNPWCPEEALEFALYGEPVQAEVVSLRLAVTYKAVIIQLVDGSTETKFVPHATFIGETAPDDSRDDYPDAGYNGDDDIPF